MSRTNDVKKGLRSKARKPILSSKDFLSTGSTLLNLACSGRPDGGFAKGLYTYLVGDTSSGKTFLSLTCLAEAAANPEFSDYRFLYDGSENGALMDVTRFFGSEVERRLEPPAGTRDDPKYSVTLEDFYYRLDDALNAGKPFIWIEDSMDALEPSDDRDQFEKEKDAHDKGKADVSGSYGVAKAKQNSSRLRTVVNRLRETGSILILISQTRDRIGFGSQFDPKTRSGGRALSFFAHLELWSSVVGKIKSDKVNGQERQQGISCRIKVKKNRLSGRESTVDIPILWSHGIDDVGSCVDYLVAEGRWAESKGIIASPEFGLEMKREKLIQYVEEADLEGDLRRLVGETWKDIEDKCAAKRKRRYE